MKKILIKIWMALLIVTAQVLLLSCSKDNPTSPPTPVLKISSIVPNTGPKATTVVLIGEGFKANASENTVTLNGKVCPLINASTTQITLTIPPSAGSGSIQVVTSTGKALSTSFTYIYTATVSTIAGSTQGFADGNGVAVQFSRPSGVATDALGNVYVTDSGNSKIRKITPDGAVSTLAGSTYGFADGIGAAAQFDNPAALAVDGAGNLYVSDRVNNKIRKITPAGVVSTVAGSAQGFADGNGAAAQFASPYGITLDAIGNLYIADQGNHKIRKITPAGVVSTVAGSTQGFADGTGAVAQFNTPIGVALDAAGNIFVSDVANQKIRKITPSGIVSTVAGSTQGFADGTGTAAKFDGPNGVAIDASGNIYLADFGNNKIRRITPVGEVSTLAGSIKGFADGIGSASQFSNLRSVAVDVAGSVYVADQGNHKIRKIVVD
jgi:streptogramin lyase